jgi:hypothetical protein
VQLLIASDFPFLNASPLLILILRQVEDANKVVMMCELDYL